jgi:hypothetical protein
MLNTISCNFDFTGLDHDLLELYTKAFSSRRMNSYLTKIKNTNEKYGMTLEVLQGDLGSGLKCQNGMPDNTIFSVYYGKYQPLNSETNKKCNDYIFNLVKKSRKYKHGCEIDGFNTKKDPLNLAYANHSCTKANTIVERIEIEGAFVLQGRSIRTITPGEQILINYDGEEGKVGYWLHLEDILKEEIPTGFRILKCGCESTDTCPYNFARFVSANVLDEVHTSTETRPSVTPIVCKDAHESTSRLQDINDHSKQDQTGHTIHPTLPSKKQKRGISTDAPELESEPRIKIQRTGIQLRVVPEPNESVLPGTSRQQIEEPREGGMESQTLIPMSFEVNRSETPRAAKASETAPKFEICFGSGSHWKQKAAQGMSPDIVQHKLKIAEDRRREEILFLERFPGVKLPWTSKDFPKFIQAGNTLRLLWMSLYSFSLDKTILTELGLDGFWGVCEFTVPEENIEKFNQGNFPSVLSIKNMMRSSTRKSERHRELLKNTKQYTRIWGNAGFTETWENRSLKFMFKEETWLKFKKMHTTKKKDAAKSQPLPPFSIAQDPIDITSNKHPPVTHKH